MRAARLKEVSVVGNTRVTDWFCGATIGEENAYARVHAAACGDDSAGAACTCEPHEIGPQHLGGGSEKSASEEGDF